MATPNANAPVGQGGRFAALESKLSQQPGVGDPRALAAAIGQKKYGAKRLSAMARKGKQQQQQPQQPTSY